MSEIFSLLTQALGGKTTDDLGRTIGTGPSNAQSALAAALPLLLAGLARNASQPAGANDLLGALTRDHDGSALDRPADVLTPPASADGAKILPHVLGDRQQEAQRAVAKAGGIDPAAALKVLAVAAPIVMAALGRAQRQKNLDANGLSSYLTGEHQALTAEQPGLMGMATKLLDSNHDGSIADEFSAIAGKLFGR